MTRYIMVSAECDNDETVEIHPVKWRNISEVCSDVVRLKTQDINIDTMESIKYATSLIYDLLCDEYVEFEVFGVSYRIEKVDC